MPMTISVIESRPRVTPDEPPADENLRDLGLAVTIHHVDDAGLFRVSISNLGVQQVYERVTLQWWVFIL